MHQPIKFGLIGKTLTHSFSKKYFEEKYAKNDFVKYGIPPSLIKKLSYELYEFENIDEVRTLIENPCFQGFNITIPYKQAIIPFLSQLDSAAHQIGAVNVARLERVHRQKVKTVGYNTDYLGFTRSLLNWLPKNMVINQLKALILGTGGASKAIAYALKRLDISYQFISRKKSGDNTLSYYDLMSKKEVFATHHLIVNTTPLGTYPDVDAFPQLPYHLTTSDHFFYDLVYNPSFSLFLKKGREKGAKIINGYNMLVEQAEASWDIWLRNRAMLYTETFAQ